MHDERLNEDGMLLHATETCLFDGCLGLEHNSIRIQKMARRYGWSGTVHNHDHPDHENFLEDTDQAMDYLNQHAMAEGYYVAFVDGDVMVLAELDDEA